MAAPASGWRPCSEKRARCSRVPWTAVAGSAAGAYSAAFLRCRRLASSHHGWSYPSVSKATSVTFSAPSSHCIPYSSESAVQSSEQCVTYRRGVASARERPIVDSTCAAIPEDDRWRRACASIDAARRQYVGSSAPPSPPSPVPAPSVPWLPSSLLPSLVAGDGRKLGRKAAASTPKESGLRNQSCVSAEATAAGRSAVAARAAGPALTPGMRSASASSARGSSARVRLGSRAKSRKSGTQPLARISR